MPRARRRGVGALPDAEPVHLIAVPETEDGLRRAIGDAHRRRSRRINLREGWRGHLFQGRFSSFAMDEAHLRAAGGSGSLHPRRQSIFAGTACSFLF